MKKKTWLAVLIGSLFISLLGFGISHITASSGEEQLTTQEIRKLVQDRYPGQIKEIELEREDGQFVYEVEIKGEQGEYELKLDARSGDVIHLQEKASPRAEKNEKKLEQINQAPDVDITTNNTGQPVPIGVEEAKQIARSEVTGKIEEIELDEEDGLLVYEVEIETKDHEVELVIDAYTGKILSIAWDD